MSAIRIFKTKRSAKEASPHGTSDDELYQAIQSALQSKVIDLGGGAYKKRLNKDRDHAIVLTKNTGYWFYIFLYAKQDMANIDRRELVGFHELAKHYANLSEKKTTILAKGEELVKIYNDSKK